MKINSIKLNTGYLKGRASESQLGREKECATKRHSLMQNNNDQINTTITSNSDGRVSFKGGAPFLHKAAKFAYENPLFAEATFALLITCFARPLTIMATAKTEKDKEKCSYQAAKSITSGLIGLGMTAVIANPIKTSLKNINENDTLKKEVLLIPKRLKDKSEPVVKSGIEALKDFAKRSSESGKNSELVATIGKLINDSGINLSVFREGEKQAEKKFFASLSEAAPNITETVSNAFREQRRINNYPFASKNIMEKFFQPIFMPLRAKVTIALVPVILGVMFGSKKIANKKAEKNNEQQNTVQPENKYNNCNLFLSDSEKVLFQSFSGVANHENQ